MPPIVQPAGAALNKSILKTKTMPSSTPLNAPRNVTPPAKALSKKIGINGVASVPRKTQTAWPYSPAIIPILQENAQTAMGLIQNGAYLSPSQNPAVRDTHTYMLQQALGLGRTNEALMGLPPGTLEHGVNLQELCSSMPAFIQDKISQRLQMNKNSQSNQ